MYHHARNFLAFLPPVYGVARKLPALYNGEVRSFNKDTCHYETRPMLTTEKGGIIVMCAGLSYGCIPFWAYNDINMLEIRMKKLDPVKFGYPNKLLCWTDYLLN